MKFKEYNPETQPSHRGPLSSPVIRLNVISGTITISKTLCERLKITEIDRISFLQDEDEPENWYIEKTSKGFGLNPVQKQLGTFRFSSTSTVRDIFNSVEFKGKRGNLLVAGEPTKVNGRILHGILTSHLVNI